MRSFLRLTAVAACLFALGANVPAVAAAQGKAKGQAKQEQKGKDGKPQKTKPNRGGDDENFRFQGVDRNGDGIITRNEWEGDDRSFQNHDWNGDGRLTGDELRPDATRPGRIDDDDRLLRWDSNRDGMLSRTEWQGATEVFNRLDVNHDGVLTRAELVGRR